MFQNTRATFSSNQRVNKVKALCMLLYQVSYSPNLSLAVTKKPPKPPKAPLWILFYSVVKVTAPPTGSSDWMIRMLEYLIRHLARSCDWTQPVQLCKWAPGGACWPGCVAGTEQHSRGSDSERGRSAWTLGGFWLFLKKQNKKTQLELKYLLTLSTGFNSSLFIQSVETKSGCGFNISGAIS